jgi:hypothetical protein
MGHRLDWYVQLLDQNDHERNPTRRFLHERNTVRPNSPPIPPGDTLDEIMRSWDENTKEGTRRSRFSFGDLAPQQTTGNVQMSKRMDIKAAPQTVVTAALLQIKGRA